MYVEFFSVTSDKEYKKCLFCLNKNDKYKLFGGEVFFAILPDNSYITLSHFESIKEDIFEMCSEFEIDEAYNFNRINSLFRNKKIDTLLS